MRCADAIALADGNSAIRCIQILYEVLKQDFPVQGTECIQVWKRIALASPVL